MVRLLLCDQISWVQVVKTTSLPKKEKKGRGDGEVAYKHDPLPIIVMQEALCIGNVVFYFALPYLIEGCSFVYKRHLLAAGLLDLLELSSFAWLPPYITMQCAYKI